MPTLIESPGPWQLKWRWRARAKLWSSGTMPEHADYCDRAADRIPELDAALRVVVDGYYSDDESLPTLEQWDDARVALTKS